MSNTVRCPHCRKNFELSDAVEGDIRARLVGEFEAKAEKLRDEVEEERKELAQAKEALDAQCQSIEKEVTRRLEANRKALETAAREKASVELESIRQELAERDEKLLEAQKNEVELRRQQRALEQEKNEFQLKLTRQLDVERSKIIEETSRKVADEFSFQRMEWSKQRGDLLKQVEELKRKAEQGSQQTQGEALELEIEALLKEAFPDDEIEPVEKGVKGADIVLNVRTRAGAKCGSVVVELKRTKSFSEGWIEKVKDDMRAAKADIAVIASAVLPKGVERIAQSAGVWICDHKSLLGLLLALRAGILEAARARDTQAGRKTKAEQVYDYVNGVEFRGRVQALVEAFTEMKTDLDAERRAFEKLWSRREKQLVRALGSTAGLYGDVQGLVGASALPEIKTLSLESIL
jgi:hypothetical protein